MLGRIRRSICRAELAPVLAMAIGLGWLSPLMSAPLSFDAVLDEQALEIASTPVLRGERIPPPLMPELEDSAAADRADVLSTRLYLALAPPAETNKARPSASRPFETVERMPAGYATLMFGTGFLLLVVSVALGYLGRFIAPYSATGDEAAQGGHPPLPPLVVLRATEAEARG